MITNSQDVASRLGRPLTPDEDNLASVLILDVENMIRVRLPGRVLNDDTIDVSLLPQVVGAAVARVLKNPDGYRSEAAGGVSYTIDTRAAAGFLTILTEEWNLLGLPALTGSAGAGSFAPALGTAYATPSWRLRECDPWF